MDRHQIQEAKLWEIDQPNLYKVGSTVRATVAA